MERLVLVGGREWVRERNAILSGGLDGGSIPTSPWCFVCSRCTAVVAAAGCEAARFVTGRNRASQTIAKQDGDILRKMG